MTRITELLFYRAQCLKPEKFALRTQVSWKVQWEESAPMKCFIQKIDFKHSISLNQFKQCPEKGCVSWVGVSCEVEHGETYKFSTLLNVWYTRVFGISHSNKNRSPNVRWNFVSFMWNKIKTLRLGLSFEEQIKLYWSIECVKVCFSHEARLHSIHLYNHVQTVHVQSAERHLDLCTQYNCPLIENLLSLLVNLLGEKLALLSLV